MTDLKSRYGSDNTAAKIMFGLVALALIVLGAIWTFGTTGTTRDFGPVVGGLGVALGYVVLIQKRG
ncbi:hypothetical protein [Nocardioides nematodiphilus]|uniref:hypothetical protein n=1 Tax=Nocardioides nematodiphilus TaxID=2849669 RepID=UPI001CD98A02|nr:hypothetical protein [Nocardioides nematodiphilus]MCA1983815.1 hypothetical protein [Nocardioides nematodiphilus]